MKLVSLARKSTSKWILRLVHRNQYGFIRTRTIQDCLAWSYEYLHQCHASGAACVILKIDFEKAFDTVEHHAIIEILKCKGFDDRWINMVKLVLESGSSSVLANGVPGKEFCCKRGVRQGDPLSPLLFVSMGDLLQSVVNAAHEDGLLQLPIPQPASEDYPIIQYTDDTIVVLPACAVQLRRMQVIIQSFARSTGLKINFSKTQLIPINISGELASELAETIGCCVGAMPFTYLGLPMGTTWPTVEDLMPLVNAVERRLSSSALWLTYGGRLTYINSAITPLVTFALCTLQIPLKIFEYCDRARRHCLWRKFVNREEKTQSLSSWNMVCRPKKKGGLGVIDLRIQNNGLLLKYLDKFYRRCDVPWVQIVWSKYYDDAVPHARPRCGSFWWRDMMSLVSTVRGITECQVKAGDIVLLWKDSWTKPKLCESAPRLFSFASNEDISVREFVENDNLEDLFQLPLSIEAHDELMQLREQVTHDSIDSTCPDIWKFVWGAESYKPSDFYKFCFRNLVPPDYLKAILKSRCAMKHRVFAWLMLVNRINTRDMLRRRNLDIGTVFSCLTCDSGVLETRNHLFFGCNFAQDCWTALDISWDLTLALPNMFSQAKRDWRLPLFTEVVILGAWNIWKVRNRVYFDGVQQDLVTWKRQVSQDLICLGYRLKEGLQAPLAVLIARVTP